MRLDPAEIDALMNEYACLPNMNALILTNNNLCDREIPLCWGRWNSLRQLALEGNVLKIYGKQYQKGTETFKRYLRSRAGDEDY